MHGKNFLLNVGYGVVYFDVYPHCLFQGVGTKESVLIEILCSRTNAEINAIKQAYHKSTYITFIRGIANAVI
jgi:hypothetical protein